MNEGMGIQQKIRKLLAIAGDSSASDAERATALSTAQRLAERHAIDMASVGAEARHWGTSVLKTFADDSRLPAWCGFVIALLEEFFFVRLITHRHYTTESLVCCDLMSFGAECDRKVASYVFAFLRREFLRLKTDREKQLRRNLRAAEQRAFYAGVAKAVYEQLDRERDGRRPEAAADSRAMIAVNDAIDRALVEAFPAVAYAKDNRRAFSPDWHGYRAGQSVQVRKPLPSEQQEPLCLGVAQ